jgi:hypothetical protein
MTPLRGSSIPTISTSWPNSMAEVEIHLRPDVPLDNTAAAYRSANLSRSTNRSERSRREVLRHGFNDSSRPAAKRRPLDSPTRQGWDHREPEKKKSPAVRQGDI